MASVPVDIQAQDKTLEFPDMLKGHAAKPSVVAIQETNLDAIKRATVFTPSTKEGPCNPCIRSLMCVLGVLV